MMPIWSLESVIESTEYRVSLTMVSDGRSPGAARTFTRETLSAWGLEDLMDRTVLIVSELTTNAERHGGTPGGTERPADANGQMVAEHITLTLTAQSGIVGIEVEDNSPLAPIPRASGPDSLDGRVAYFTHRRQASPRLPICPRASARASPSERGLAGVCRRPGSGGHPPHD